MVHLLRACPWLNGLNHWPLDLLRTGIWLPVLVKHLWVYDSPSPVHLFQTCASSWSRSKHFTSLNARWEKEKVGRERSGWKVHNSMRDNWCRVFMAICPCFCNQYWKNSLDLILSSSTISLLREGPPLPLTLVLWHQYSHALCVT